MEKGKQQLQQKVSKIWDKEMAKQHYAEQREGSVFRGRETERQISLVQS